jgi:hypothetical protein
MEEGRGVARLAASKFNLERVRKKQKSNWCHYVGNRYQCILVKANFLFIFSSNYCVLKISLLASSSWTLMKGNLIIWMDRK